MGARQLIVAGNLLDGSGAGARKNALLLVEDGVISAVASAGELAGHHGAAMVDLAHCTLVPPLVDCSVFLRRSPSLAGGQAAAAEGLAAKAMFQRHLLDCHSHGVLGVADNDDLGELLAAQPGGAGREELIAIRAPSPAGCKPRGKAAGAPAGGDFYKIYYSGSIEEQQLAAGACLPRDPGAQPPPHHPPARPASGKTVAVANGRQPVAAALAAGCDAIEQGYGMGEDNLRELARRNILWIPSLLRAQNALAEAGGGGGLCCRFSLRQAALGKPNPDAEEFWRRTLKAQLGQLALARQLGVKTALGTAAGTPGILHGEAMVEELKLFIKAGYALEEAICCASTNGAEFFGLEHLGPLTSGRPATFLLSRGTTRQLPRKLSYLEGIYLNGTPSPFYRKNP